MAGRKIGVGFNQPLVLDGRMQFDWQRRWELYRRIGRNKSPIRGAPRYQAIDFARANGRELIPKRKAQ
jgi:hypothetical protein